MSSYHLLISLFIVLTFTMPATARDSNTYVEPDQLKPLNQLMWKAYSALAEEDQSFITNCVKIQDTVNGTTRTTQIKCSASPFDEALSIFTTQDKDLVELQSHGTEKLLLIYAAKYGDAVLLKKVVQLFPEIKESEQAKFWSKFPAYGVQLLATKAIHLAVVANNPAVIEVLADKWGKYILIAKNNSRLRGYSFQSDIDPMSLAIVTQNNETVLKLIELENRHENYERNNLEHYGQALALAMLFNNQKMFEAILYGTPAYSSWAVSAFWDTKKRIDKHNLATISSRQKYVDYYKQYYSSFKNEQTRKKKLSSLEIPNETLIHVNSSVTFTNSPYPHELLDRELYRMIDLEDKFCTYVRDNGVYDLTLAIYYHKPSFKLAKKKVTLELCTINNDCISTVFKTYLGTNKKDFAQLGIDISKHLRKEIEKHPEFIARIETLSRKNDKKWVETNRRKLKQKHEYTMVRLREIIKSKNYQQALEFIDSASQEGVITTGDLLYFKGRLNYSIGNLDKAKLLLDIYLKINAGKELKHLKKAQALLQKLENT